jgi:hypothetical protein
MWETLSPFEFDGPVAPERMIGRRQEADTIKQWALRGRFMALVAPRRYGKTSLIRKISADGRGDGLTVIAADLFEVASTADLVLRLERAWAQHTPKQWRSAVSKILTGAQVGVSIAGSGFALTLADKPHTDPLPALHTLLDLPMQLSTRHKGRTLIVFDEFQSVAKLSGAEALIRSHAQHHREFASYLFSGSEPGMLAAAFDDRARPFYGQVETFRLGRLPAAELGEAIEHRFASAGRDVSEVLTGLIAASEGHPQRAMLLAHLLWQQVPSGHTATSDDLQAAIAASLHRVDPEARATISGLADGQRKTLRAVAEYDSPMAARALRTLSLPKTTAQRAAPHLISAGLIEQNDQGWGVVDPLLARWIRTNYATRA